MKHMAEYTYTHGLLRLGRILRKCLHLRGLEISGLPCLYAGHWWVHRKGIWIRTTDALNLELLPLTPGIGRNLGERSSGNKPASRASIQ